MSSSRRPVLQAAAAALLLLCGCDWLLQTDKTPPYCRVTSPVDSSVVSGVVPFKAEATDSTWVDRVEFFADGALLGADTAEPYGLDWDASGLAEGTWHMLSCIAYDGGKNKGYSDTVSVVIGEGQPVSVFHGVLELAGSHYYAVRFAAQVGDTLSGDMTATSGGTLGMLLVLDSDNYESFRAGNPYTSLYRQDNARELSLVVGFAVSGNHYVVFVNPGSTTVKVWARLMLE